MKDLGIYSPADFGKVSDMVNNMTDDQIALLAQYYHLTRAKTQQDASLYAMQQRGYSDTEVDGQKAQIADILTRLQNEIDVCYAQLQTLGTPAQYLGQVVYSSVPGWCAYSQCCVPAWYYADGCYVGCASTPVIAAPTRDPFAPPTTTTAATSTRSTTGAPISTAASTGPAAKPAGTVTRICKALSDMTASLVTSLICTSVARTTSSDRTESVKAGTTAETVTVRGRRSRESTSTRLASLDRPTANSIRHTAAPVHDR